MNLTHVTPDPETTLLRRLQDSKDGKVELRTGQMYEAAEALEKGNLEVISSVSRKRYAVYTGEIFSQKIEERRHN